MAKISTRQSLMHIVEDGNLPRALRAMAELIEATGINVCNLADVTVECDDESMDWYVAAYEVDRHTPAKGTL